MRIKALGDIFAVLASISVIVTAIFVGYQTWLLRDSVDTANKLSLVSSRVETCTQFIKIGRLASRSSQDLVFKKNNPDLIFPKELSENDNEYLLDKSIGLYKNLYDFIPILRFHMPKKYRDEVDKTKDFILHTMHAIEAEYPDIPEYISIENELAYEASYLNLENRCDDITGLYNE